MMLRSAVLSSHSPQSCSSKLLPPRKPFRGDTSHGGQFIFPLKK